MLKSRLLGKRDYLLQIVEAGRIPFFNQKFMGREGTDMETKALKKQLGAAIAMVVVAAIALGSATYAWFVSNNSVTATTNNVYAMSNSAYLVIANAKDGETSASSTTIATASETTSSVALYPATWANTFTKEKGSTKADSTNAGVYQFETAYASDKDNSAETVDANGNKITRFAIGGPSDAIDKDAPYAYLNTFHIGTGTYAGIFKDLKVTGFKVSNTSGESKSELPSAMRALVKCGDNWAVVKMSDDGKTAKVVSQSGKTDETAYDGIIRSDKFGKGQTVSDAQVDVYLFYEGSDDNVKTTNLANLTDCHVEITFEATPTEYGKTSTGA